MSVIIETLNQTIGNVNDHILLTVELGDKQHVAHCILRTPDGVYHFGDQKDPNDADPFHNFNMGSGSALKGKDSKLTVTVTDTNPLTNFASITVTLTNNAVSKVYDGMSAHDNGTVIYLITLKHV